MRLKKNYTIRSLGDKRILVPLQSRPTAEKGMHIAELGESVLWLLGQLDGREFTVADAAVLVSERYGIDMAHASADVDALVATLCTMDMIEY